MKTPDGARSRHEDGISWSPSKDRTTSGLNCEAAAIVQFPRTLVITLQKHRPC